MTVPVEETPPTTLPGLTLSADTEISRIRKLALMEIPACVALTLATVLLVTLDVPTVKLIDVAPAGMLTVAGTVATVASLVVSAKEVDEVTVALSLSVAIEVLPPPIVVGLRESVKLRIDSVPVRVVPA